MPDSCWSTLDSTLTVRSRKRSLNWSSSRPFWRCEYAVSLPFTWTMSTHCLFATVHRNPVSIFTKYIELASRPCPKEPTIIHGFGLVGPLMSVNEVIKIKASGRSKHAVLWEPKEQV